MNAREAQRRETEAKVLSCAAQLFHERGFASTTVRDIATACGVSAGTVISVGEKSTLLVASFDQRIRTIHENRAEAGGERLEGDPVERILRLFDPLLSLFTEQPELARIYGSILVAGEHPSTVFTELSALLVHEISTVLSGTNTQSDGEPCNALAEGIYFAYLGRLFSWPKSEENDPSGLRRDLRGIVAAICTNKGEER